MQKISREEEKQKISRKSVEKQKISRKVENQQKSRKSVEKWKNRKVDKTVIKQTNWG